MNTDRIKAEFQMIGHRIKSLSVKNDFFNLDDNAGIKRKIDLAHTIEYCCEESEQCHVGVVILDIKVELRYEASKARIRLEIEGGFQAGKAIMAEEEFKKMLGINGISTLYAVARGIISSVSAQTFVEDVIILPMINVYNYSKEKGN